MDSEIPSLFFFLLCAGFTLTGGNVLARTAGVVVRTTDGRVAGTRASGTHVVSFKGIPYAAPPVGKLRWQPPRQVIPWRGIRGAYKFSDSCMQDTPREMLPWTPVFMTHLPVSEDCLYLNVWTPSVSANADLPVIVFIHGGGFVSGAGSIRIYNGQQLASKGAVVVTFNYRLGVFGFFANQQLASESAHHAAGNYGLLDQIAALHWVQENIRGFGGNPSKVTIWGQSAGAMSVEALTLSPLAKGLFAHAQADSGIGVATGVELSLADAERRGAAFAKSIGAPSLAQLRAMPAAELLSKADNYARSEPQAPFSLPDIDGWVLPAPMSTLTARGSGSDVPLIVGWNANDWMLFQPPVGSISQYQHLADRFYGPMYARFLKLYPASDAAQARQMQALSSQDRDRVQSYLWANRRTARGTIRSPIYLYFFERAIPWPEHTNFGAFHSSELPYFFGNLSFMKRPWQDTDYALSQEMGGDLLRFAATGDPNRPRSKQWEPLVASRTVMGFGNHVTSVPLCSSKARCAFWRAYFDSVISRDAPAF